MAHLFLLDSMSLNCHMSLYSSSDLSSNCEKLCIPLLVFFSLLIWTKNSQVSTVFNGEKKDKDMTIKMLSPNFFHNFLKEDVELWAIQNFKLKDDITVILFTIVSS